MSCLETGFNPNFRPTRGLFQGLVRQCIYIYVYVCAVQFLSLWLSLCLSVCLALNLIHHSTDTERCSKNMGVLQVVWVISEDARTHVYPCGCQWKQGGSDGGCTETTSAEGHPPGIRLSSCKPSTWLDTTKLQGISCHDAQATRHLPDMTLRNPPDKTLSNRRASSQPDTRAARHPPDLTWHTWVVGYPPDMTHPSCTASTRHYKLELHDTTVYLYKILWRFSECMSIIAWPIIYLHLNLF